MTRNIDPENLKKSDVNFGIAVTPIYIDESRSVSLEDVFGENFVTMSTTFNTEREVCWGEGDVFVEGDKIHVREGARFTAPPNKAYQDAGHMLILATTTPPNGRTEVFKSLPSRLTQQP